MSKYIPYHLVEQEQEMQVVRKIFQNYKKAKELEEKVKKVLEEKKNDEPLQTT